MKNARRSYRRFTLVLLLFLFQVLIVDGRAQSGETLDEQHGFLLDVISLRGDSAETHRVDVYVVIPYQSLQFEKRETSYRSNFTVRISVRDKSGERLRTESVSRVLDVTEYTSTQGINAEFDYIQKVYSLPPGDYEVEVLVRDVLAQRELSRRRRVSVIDYRSYPFSISGILLAGAIAQQQGRYTVTPHVTDDVTSMLTDGFFAFFESYNNSPLISAFDATWQILDSDGDVMASGERMRQVCEQNRQQHFVKVNLPADISPGNFVLKVLALRIDAGEELQTSDILAVSEHSLRIEMNSQFGPIGDEALWTAIRQMRYVATQEELNVIEAGADTETRRERFFDFWRNIDPTPGTLRNEAYDEFYARIDYVNKKFRSYSAGWLTDMGRVFIIFGPPQDVQRQDYRTDGRVVERWSYPNNREFIFVDYKGFGDFRLSSPLSPSDKYRYGRN